VISRQVEVLFSPSKCLDRLYGHPASIPCLRVYLYFFLEGGGGTGQGMNLTNHPHLVSRLSISKAVPVLKRMLPRAGLN
jgi:hypothetical protein